MVPELYYFIPWPQSQILSELDEKKEHWSSADADFGQGAFVEKAWFDEVTYEDYRKTQKD